MVRKVSSTNAKNLHMMQQVYLPQSYAKKGLDDQESGLKEIGPVKLKPSTP
jgi:hypothetical protein